MRPYDRSVIRVLLPPFVLAVLMSGCGAGDDPVADVPAPGPSRVEQSTDPSPGGTATGRARTPRAPSSHPTPTSRPTSGHKSAPGLPARGRSTTLAHLLGEDVMPNLARGDSWVVQEQGPEGDQAVGACQKTPLVSIGAMTATRRLYAVQDGGARATQVVARFADSESAWRAHEVLRSWREDCEKRLDFPRKDIGPMQDVPVDAGIGASYAAAYGPKPEAKGVSAGFGIVRKGAYLSIVEISAPASEWPPDRDPARAAVRRIARTFETS